jgi:hypothetical protein
MAAAVWSASGDSRLRKERRGVTKCFGARSRGRMRGERKGEGDGGDGAPYIGDTSGGRGWATGSAMRR